MATEPNEVWSELKPLAESGRVDEILARIRGVGDDAERIALSRATMRHLAFGEWQNKDLDVMTAIADYAIEECEGLAGDFLEQANIICYNTSANLCDCWADDFSREPRHFEKGIAYAKKALWFRDHLGKGPGSKAMANWALGKHLQSLGRLDEAAESFRHCLDLETEAAKADGKPTAISSDAPDGYLIAAAYVALIERDRSVLEQLKLVLDEMLAKGGEAKIDAEIIITQLRETAKQLGIDYLAGAEAVRHL